MRCRPVLSERKVQELYAVPLARPLTYLHWLAGKLLLAFASILILGSEHDGTHDPILLPDGSRSLQNP
jgi:hypothetical protein